MASIEEKVEEHYKKKLDELGIRHYGKTESINRTITDALRSADSKSGGSGNNYPDIQLLFVDCACLFSKHNTDSVSNIAKTQH